MSTPADLNPLDPSDTTDPQNPRTQAMLQRLQQAMRDIETDIAQHHGVYPYNHGRVTQSELCRRADVKKATLQTPLHKHTTREAVLRWLDELAGQLTQTRDATREKVTAQADELAAQVQQLSDALAAAQARIRELETELAVRHQTT